jgi:translocation and assembly module TamB
LGSVLAVAALPFWLGRALPLVGRPLHLTFGSYRRLGYERFEVRDVVYQRNNVKVTVAQAEYDTPALWVWRHLRHQDREGHAQGWAVLVTRSDLPPVGPRRVTGMVTLHPLLEKIADRLGTWLPRAAITRGSVQWPKGGFTLREARWEKGTMRLAGLQWMAGSADGTIVFQPGGHIQIDAQELDRAWTVSLNWTGADATGRATAWEQPVEVSGHYADVGWMPATARAETGQWSVAANRAGLGEVYGALKGNGWAQWKNNAFEVSIHVQADPKAAHAPRLQIAAHARGDHAGWTVDELQVALPYGHARLDQPVNFGYGGKWAVQNAHLDFAADLAALPAWMAHGKVTGQASISARTGALPVVTLNAKADAAGWKTYPEGNYTVSGTVDLQRRTLKDAQLKGRWSAAALKPWLPAGMSAGDVALDAVAAGPWNDLSHSGHIAVSQMEYKPVAPVAATAAWTGRGFQADRFDVRLVAARSSLFLAGSVRARQLDLSALQFKVDGAEALSLEAPARIEWSPQWEVSGLRLRGPTGAAELEHRPGDAFLARLRMIPSQWVEALVGWSGPDCQLTSLDFAGHWEHERLVFSAQTEASAVVAGRTARLSVSAEGSGASIKIVTGRILDGGQPLGHFEGLLPVAWNRAARPHWQIDWNAPAAVSLQTVPDSPFWPALAASFGVKLVHPNASVQASGSLTNPVGELHVSLEELSAARKLPWKIPALENVKLDAHADRAGLMLDHLTGSIAGQPVVASGRMPMSEQRWRQMAEHSPTFDWKGVDARLDVQDAEIAPLATYLPNFFAQRGRWSVHFRLVNGEWNGLLQISDAALRPIPPLGQLQNITGGVAWKGRAVELRHFTADLGGQTLALTGRADFPLHGTPQYAFDLKGEAVPLVRRANLLIRADLDLHAGTRGDTTRVTGKVDVQDGLLLGDLADLLPSGITGGQRPPPYFEVDSPVLGKWLLDVQLTAQRSLRARTTLFTGTASAQFDLSGTLQDPRAVGILRVDQGQISLPFATFDVQVGTVRLTADDPFHPRVDVSASARRSDYDLRMSATGPADAPVLTFTSNPALPSDQVLLLVMAGQMPSSNGAIGATQSQVAGLGAYFGQSIFSGLSGDGNSDRLTISSGQEISVKGKPTYQVEYRVAPRWWLVGQYDQFDDYNAGVKWRVYSGDQKKK